MDTKEIIDQINEYPRGYVSKKKIKGKYYYYLQYTENCVKVSEYVQEFKLKDVKDGIEKRHNLENILKAIEDGQRDIVIPSKSAKNLSGYLMMGDEVVASFKDGMLEHINNEKAPLLIKKTGNIEEFLKGRAIDRDRAHSRILKKVLDIHEDEDYIVSLYSFGATITDNYWFKPKQSKIKYKDISYTDDEYWRISLKGDVGYVPKSPKYSPQLTLIGSYEKCWRLIDGHWWLYKSGNDKEIFSELFCSKFAQLMNVPTASYEYSEGYIRTKNIAEDVNLEPVSSIAGNDDTYDVVFNALESINSKLAREYIKLICFDAVVNNVDRHNENCGILRDRNNGSIISLAPNFDNNLSLVSVTSNLSFMGKRDGHFNYLERFFKNNPVAKSYFLDTKLKDISKKDITSCIPEVLQCVDAKLVAKYVFDRYRYLQNLQKAMNK